MDSHECPPYDQVIWLGIPSKGKLCREARERAGMDLEAEDADPDE